MKTKIKNDHAISTPSDQGTDNNKPKKFEVHLQMTQRSRTKIIIEADYFFDAVKKADAITFGQIRQWGPQEGCLDVAFIEEVKEGGSNV